ncbi:MFS transporter [soil metagenome]
MGQVMSEQEGGARSDGYPISPAQSWFSVGIFLFVAILAYLDRLVISLLVEPIRASLHVTDFQIGLLQGVAFGLFYAVFGLPIGWLVDRYSRRTIVYVGMTLWSVAAACCGLASTYTQLLIARFGVGVGEASLGPAVYSMIADLFPPRRLALAVGVFATGSAIGGGIAYMAGGIVIQKLEAMGEIVLPFIGEVQPWQAVFIMTGAPGILVALLLWLVPEPKRVKAAPRLTQGSKDGFVALLASNKRYFICHFLGFGLVAVMAYGISAWAPVMLMRRYGMNVGQVGGVLGIVSLAGGVAGFLFGGWFVDRWYARGTRDAHLRYFVYTCLVGAALSLVAFLVADDLWTFVPPFLLIHFLQPFTGPAIAHLQLATPREYRGRMTALFGLVFNLMGMCLGPPSVAFFTDFVFHDPLLVNQSLALMYVSSGLLAAGLFWYALPAARRAVMEAEA